MLLASWHVTLKVCSQYDENLFADHVCSSRCSRLLWGNPGMRRSASISTIDFHHFCTLSYTAPPVVLHGPWYPTWPLVSYMAPVILHGPCYPTWPLLSYTAPVILHGPCCPTRPLLSYMAHVVSKTRDPFVKGRPQSPVSSSVLLFVLSLIVCQTTAATSGCL